MDKFFLGLERTLNWSTNDLQCLSSIFNKLFLNAAN